MNSLQMMILLVLPSPLISTSLAPSARNASTAFSARHPSLCLEEQGRGTYVRAVNSDGRCRHPDPGESGSNRLGPIRLRAAGLDERTGHWDGGVAREEGGLHLTRVNREVWDAVALLSGVELELSADRSASSMHQVITMVKDGDADVLVNLIEICCGREETMRGATPILPR